MLSKHKKNQESKSKSCHCKKQLKKIRKQLDRIENAIKSLCGQPPTGNECPCRATFFARLGDMGIDGTICPDCKVMDSLVDGRQWILNISNVNEFTCSNNKMTVSGSGEIVERGQTFAVTFDMELIQNPDSISITVKGSRSFGVRFNERNADRVVVSITRCR